MKHNQQNSVKYHVCFFYFAAKRLSGILHRLQLTPESLSRGGNSSLTALTKLGMLLDVKDSSSTR